MIKSKLIAGTMLLSIVASLTTVYADSLSQKRSHAEHLRSEVTRAEQQIQNDQKQEQMFKNQVNAISDSLSTIGNSLHDNQNQYTVILNRVNILQKKMDQNATNLNAAKSQLENDLRFTYENGNSTYLSVLFQSESFSDFVSRFDELSMVAQSQHQVVNDFANLRGQLLTQSKSLTADKKTLESRRTQLEHLQFLNNSLKAQKSAALRNASVRERRDSNAKYTLESQLHETQDQIQQIMAETKAAEQHVTNATYIQQTQRSFANVSQNEVIGYAERFIGLPYVWGGTSPNPGFDCSGFTQYVYTHFGIPLQRTSEEQFAQGISVSQDNLKPGDLVFFSTYAPGATHVGIYVGNGMMINSEDEGLKITSMSLSYWATRYIGARRVMNAT